MANGLIVSETYISSDYYPVKYMEIIRKDNKCAVHYLSENGLGLGVSVLAWKDKDAFIAQQMKIYPDAIYYESNWIDEPSIEDEQLARRM